MPDLLSLYILYTDYQQNLCRYFYVLYKGLLGGRFERSPYLKINKGYQLSTRQIEGIFEIAIEGEIAENAVEILQNEVFAVLKSAGARNVVVDVRNVKGRFGPIEAYFRVRSYPPDMTRLNTAVVDLPEHADFETFHETTGRNAGLSMKWFTDINDARSWLKNR